MWKIKAAIRLALQRLKHPLVRLHSYDWSTEDHAHICTAARLLESDDFEAVCPLRGRGDVEYANSCDYCPHLKILEFDSDEETGAKTITLV